MNIQAYLIEKDNEITTTVPLIQLVKRLHADNETIYELIKTPTFQKRESMLNDAYATIGTNLTRIACIQNRLGFIVEYK